MNDSMEFYALGFEKIHPVSAQHGLNIAELLDDLITALPIKMESVTKEDEREQIKIAKAAEGERDARASFIGIDMDKNELAKLFS